MWMRLRTWARQIKLDVLMLWLAARDPRTPWQAKLLAGVVAAYALSPVDLIPDFIPVLGYLDDLILVPIGIWLAVKLIPMDLVVELRSRADKIDKPTSRTAAIVVVAIWLAVLVVIGVAVALSLHPPIVT